jgi:hypothetical protein
MRQTEMSAEVGGRNIPSVERPDAVRYPSATVCSTLCVIQSDARWPKI